MASLLTNIEQLAKDTITAIQAVPTADLIAHAWKARKEILEKCLGRVRATYDPNDDGVVDDTTGIRGKVVDAAGRADGDTLIYRVATDDYKHEPGGGGGGGDMLKADYATANPNKVDTALDAERLGGSLPATYNQSGDAAAAVNGHLVAIDHGNIPTAGEKAALPGTSGAPGAGNKYVTDADARNSDARTPTAHAGTHATGQPDAMAPGDIGASAVGHHHNGGDIDTAVANATNAATAAAVPWAGITGKPATIDGPLVFRLATGETISHDVGAPLARGQFVFDASAYTGGSAWTLRMVGWVSGITSPLTCRARLYNLDDDEYVTDADVDTTATEATLDTSAALTVGSGAGDLQDTATLYEIRMEPENGVFDTDTAHFGSVELVRG